MLWQLAEGFHIMLRSELVCPGRHETMRPKSHRLAMAAYQVLGVQLFSFHFLPPQLFPRPAPRPPPF